MIDKATKKFNDKSYGVLLEKRDQEGACLRPCDQNKDVDLGEVGQLGLGRRYLNN